MRILAAAAVVVTVVACGRQRVSTDDAPPSSSPPPPATVPPVLPPDDPTGPSAATAAASASASGPAFVAKPLPAGFGELRSATRLDVREHKYAFGVMHAALTRVGGSFAMNAKVVGMDGWLGEGAIDPTFPPSFWPSCVCAVEAKCGCEQGKIARKTGGVRAATVVHFLSMLAKAKLDATQDAPSVLSDPQDHDPYVHVVAFVAGHAPIHVWSESGDQPWRVSGSVLERNLSADLHGAWDAIANELGFETAVAAQNPRVFAK